MPLVVFDDQPLSKTKKEPDSLKINLTEAHIGFILDESSSMVRVWQDTISGFNYYINSLREELPNAKLTFASFVNSEFKLRAADKPIDEVLPLNSKSYTPYGQTPLVDSCMHIIAMIEQKLNVNAATKPVVVIQTDGQENFSKSFTFKHLNDLIREKRNEGWRFILLTCAFDPTSLSHKMGVDPAASIEYGPGKTKQAFKLTARITTQAVKREEEAMFSIEDKRRLR